MVVFALIAEKDRNMLEEQPVVLFRKSPSRRRLRSAFATDDRGWTSLHVFARKGELKLVFSSLFFIPAPYDDMRCCMLDF